MILPEATRIRDLLKEKGILLGKIHPKEPDGEEKHERLHTIERFSPGLRGRCDLRNLCFVTTLINQGETKPIELHRAATELCLCKSQAFDSANAGGTSLTGRRRALLSQRKKCQKAIRVQNADVTTYRVATGFEALMELSAFDKNKPERLEEGDRAELYSESGEKMGKERTNRHQSRNVDLKTKTK